MKEDERNTAPYGAALYLQNEVRAYHLRRGRKEANDPKLGKVKANGRSGGSAAPKQDRKAKDTEDEPCVWPCICENCMSWEKYKLFIKAKEKEMAKAKEKEKAKDKKRDKDKAMGKGKESSAVVDKGQHELKRETAKETHTRPS